MCFVLFRYCKSNLFPIKKTMAISLPNRQCCCDDDLLTVVSSSICSVNMSSLGRQLHVMARACTKPSVSEGGSGVAGTLPLV